MAKSYVVYCIVCGVLMLSLVSCASPLSKESAFPAGEANIDNSRTLNVRIGMSSKSLAPVRSSLFPKETRPPRPGGVWITSEPLQLVLEHGQHRLKRSIGGMGNVTAFVHFTYDSEPLVFAVDFHDQDRPLNLDEAIKRVEALEGWLEEAGFRVHPAEVDYSVIYGREKGRKFEGIDDVRQFLPRNHRLVDDVSLRSWRDGAVSAHLTLHSWSSDDAAHPSVFEMDAQGRHYGVQLRVESQKLYDDGVAAISRDAE